MDDVLVVVRLALAAVFAVAAAAKWTDRSGTRDAARALGVPARLARFVPIALPPVELVLAVGLFPVSTAPYAAGGLAALMVAFIAIVAVNLARGRKPSCHCFGALDSEPIGPSTLVRNAVLLVAAGSVALAGERPSADILATGPLVDAALFAGLVAMAFAIARVAPTQAREAAGGPQVPDRATGPRVGDRAPALTLTDLDGSPVTLQSLTRRGVPALLVLGDLGCGSCRTMLPLIAEWQTEHHDLFTPAFVVASTAERAHRQADGSGVEHFLLRTDGPNVLEGFDGLRTPSAVLINAEGTIARTPAVGRDAAEALVRELAGWRAAPFFAPVRTRDALRGISLEVGAAAPRFRLPLASGMVVSERDLPAGPVAFVFVDAESQPSRELLAELAASEALTQRAVVVASTDEASPPTSGAPVLSDPLALLATAFGVTAVPSAVIVTDEIVSSTVAVGVDAVIALLQQTAVDLIEPEAVTAEFVPRPRGRVMAIGVNGTTVVVDPANLRYHSLEDTASVVWPWFDGTASVEEIAAELSDAFGAPTDVVRTDVLEFARQLGTAGVLDGIRSDPSS